MPIRTCIGCRFKFASINLVRIGINSEGNISFRFKEGRGAYFCSKIECIQKVCQHKKLEHAFRKKVSKEVVKQLYPELQYYLNTKKL